MKVFLLGGSNSVVSGGLNSGWPDLVEVINTAVGASSSLQNLSALLEIADIVSDDDLIVTESNVNDSFSVGVYSEELLDVIALNIDAFYFELNKAQCRKVVILMPFRNYLGRQESDSIVSFINERHRFNVDCYGFYIIDLALSFSKLPQDSIRYLMADARHPLQAITYNLASNIYKYFESRPFDGSERSASSLENIHFILNVSEIELLECEQKKNSMFKEMVYEINSAFKIPDNFQGLQLVGIGTWSDDQSCIKIFNNDVVLYKNFNSLNAFNEIVSPILVDENTFLVSVLDKVSVSEKTVNCSNAVPISPVKLTKLLFRVPNVEFGFLNENSGRVDLSFLIPDLKPFISTIKFYLAKNEEYISDLGLDVDEIILEAKAIKDSDPRLSKFLLELAFKIRPSKAIRKAIDSIFIYNE